MEKVLLVCLSFVLIVAGQNMTQNKNNGDQSKSIDLKIVGGQNAELGDFPYQCLLQIKTLQDIVVRTCGCSIVAENWVITSTTCTDNYSPANMVVGVGSVSVEDLTEGVNGQVVKVSSKVEYPGYTESTFKNDIAMLKLATDLDFNENVDRIYIPTSDLAKDSTAVVSGYGHVYEGERPSQSILHSAAVDIFKDSQCERWLQEFDEDFELPKYSFCAGSAGVCTGDEGGPLAQVLNGKPYLFGILRKTYGCGRFESPAVFNRVFEYKDWINRNIDGNTECSDLQDECVDDASCINDICVCDAGYKGDGLLKCEEDGGVLNKGSIVVFFANISIYFFTQLF